MNEHTEQLLFIYNQLYKEQDELYRAAAVRANMSDAAFWIMYHLRDGKESMTQADLCKEWFFSKQTINSATASLVKMGYVELCNDKGKGNRKILSLTDAGIEFCITHVDYVAEAERKSFQCLNAEEQELVIRLMRKQLECFRKEIENAAN